MPCRSNCSCCRRALAEAPYAGVRHSVACAAYLAVPWAEQSALALGVRKVTVVIMVIDWLSGLVGMNLKHVINKHFCIGTILVKHAHECDADLCNFRFDLQSFAVSKSIAVTPTCTSETALLNLYHLV